MTALIGLLSRPEGTLECMTIAVSALLDTRRAFRYYHMRCYQQGYQRAMKCSHNLSVDRAMLSCQTLSVNLLHETEEALISQ